MNNNRLINVSNPTESRDAANKQYVDSKENLFLKTDDSNSMLENLDLNRKYHVVNSASPINYADRANKHCVDSSLSTIASHADLTKYLSTTGGIMSGPIQMNDHRIIGLSQPSISTEAANKSYMDNKTKSST